MGDLKSLTIYFFTIFITSILGYFAEKNKKYKESKKIIFTFGNFKYEMKKSHIFTLLLVFLPMIFILGTRVNTGADFLQYTWNFEKAYKEINNLSYLFESVTEPLYMVTIVFVIKIFGNNPQIWFALMAIITFFIICKAINEIDNKINLPMFILLFGLYVYMYTFNYVRQLLATSFILLGVVYLLKNKKKSFILCIIIASLMHRSSIVFLLLLLVEKNRTIYYISTIILALFIPIIPLVVSKISFLSRYVRYFDNTTFSLGVGFLIDVIPIILLSIFANFEKIDKDSLKYKLIDFSWLIIPIRIMSYYTYALGRLFIAIALITIFGYCINYKKENNLKNICTVIIFITYFIYSFYISNNCDVFPYTGIWMK